MYYPTFTRLSTDSLGPKPPQSSTILLNQTNLIVDYISTAFQGNISINNIAFQLKPLTIVGGATPADNATTFLSTLPTGYLPNGCIVLMCYPINGGIVGSSVTVEMAPGIQSGNQIQINAIYGLTVNVSYFINILVI